MNTLEEGRKLYDAIAAYRSEFFPHTAFFPSSSSNAVPCKWIPSLESEVRAAIGIGNALRAEQTKLFINWLKENYEHT